MQPQPIYSQQGCISILENTTPPPREISYETNLEQKYFYREGTINKKEKSKYKS
jgi:hypothetical protein